MTWKRIRLHKRGNLPLIVIVFIIEFTGREQKMSKEALSTFEIKFLLGIGSALALRQLGLIMVMPFLAIYGRDLAYSTPGLIGLSLGVYGLSQALFQIPFGNWSDKIGRKPTILFGLFLFILGLLLAYVSENIYIFILARVLQGSGAIMAVAYAWVGDNIRDEQRNRGMSIIGMLVGLSATLAFIGGPILYRWFNVPQMFLLCAILAFMAWLFILIFIEGEQKAPSYYRPIKFSYLSLLKDKNITKLFTAGFITNYILVSQFFIVPQLLENSLAADGLWKVFVPATILAIFAMRVGAKYADAGHFVKVATLSFAIIFVGDLTYFTSNPYWIGLGMILFMIGYMCLVTLLPASVTKLSQKSYRGKVTGIFNTFQFIGSFIGGSLTGFLWGFNPSYSVSLLIVISAAGAIIVRTSTESTRNMAEIQ